MHQLFSSLPVCFNLLLYFVGGGLFLAPAAQSPQATSEKPSFQTGPQPREMPADMKAYMEAARIPDPQKKLEALQKFLVDFPNSQGAASANQAILEVLVKNWPDKKDQIQAQADKVIKAANSPGRAYLLNSVATTLMEAGMVDLAEDFASKSLAAIDEEVRPRRAASLAILGRVWLKKGKTAEAEKALKEAYNADPSVTDAAVGLAELAEKSGNDAAALDYLATAALTGKMKSQSRKQLEELYRKSHGDKLDGLEAILDAKYKNLYSNPVRVEAYKPTAARTERVVLIEVFSGAGCPPCVAADLAADAVMERYPRKDVAVLVYHLHIPQPDPLTNPSTEARAKFYSVRGVPSVRIDGDTETGAGGDRAMTRGVYDRFTRLIDSGLEVPAGIRLNLEAFLQGSQVKV
ncbi:MAG TPA: tetratricopeptide repeat protein, partial [Acidobacteriota bacterium]